MISLAGRRTGAQSSSFTSAHDLRGSPGRAGNSDRSTCARSTGTRLRIYVLNASTENEISIAFAAIIQRQAGALIVGTDPFLLGQRDLLVELVGLYLDGVNARITPATGARCFGLGNPLKLPLTPFVRNDHDWRDSISPQAGFIPKTLSQPATKRSLSFSWNVVWPFGVSIADTRAAAI
jgi:hypothetical protein